MKLLSFALLALIIFVLLILLMTFVGRWTGVVVGLTSGALVLSVLALLLKGRSDEHRNGSE